MLRSQLHRVESASEGFAFANRAAHGVHHCIATSSAQQSETPPVLGDFRMCPFTDRLRC